MDYTQQLSLSYYKTIAELNREHQVDLVQHQQSGRIFVKKILDIYDLRVYQNLYKHPVTGIPEILACYEENNQLILIEEYISGTTLEERIRKRQISEKDIISYTIDLCHILEQLHSMMPPVIHRDIKPSNIIVTTYNRAVLLDFNAAKLYSPDAERDTVLLGTHGYAAPEQFGFSASSPQTDIYALGITIKEMAAVLPACSDRLSEIIRQCTYLNPDARYRNTSDLKSAILNLRDGKEHGLPKTFRRFLPPGFRSGSPWKMIFALTCYALMFSLFLTVKISNTSSAALWAERGCLLMMFLALVAATFNYMNIQSTFPLCQSQNPTTRILGVLVLDGLLIFVFTMLIVLISNVL